MLLAKRGQQQVPGSARVRFSSSAVVLNEHDQRAHARRARRRRIRVRRARLGYLDHSFKPRLGGIDPVVANARGDECCEKPLRPRRSRGGYRASGRNRELTHGWSPVRWCRGGKRGDPRGGNRACPGANGCYPGVGRSARGVEIRVELSNHALDARWCRHAPRTLAGACDVENAPGIGGRFARASCGDELPFAVYLDGRDPAIDRRSNTRDHDRSLRGRRFVARVRRRSGLDGRRGPGTGQCL